MTSQKLSSTSSPGESTGAATGATTGTTPGATLGRGISLARRLLIGLVALQVVQGVLGAFYTPLLTPIARNVGMRDADWNLFDSAIAAVAALALPLLTKLGDVLGHRRVLVASTFVVAASSWLAVVATDFWTLFAAFSLQGFLAVWLPFELALVRDFAAPGEAENRVAKVSSLLIVFAMIGSVLATALGGQLFTATGGWDALQNGLDAGLAPAEIDGFRAGLMGVLMIPAVISTLAIPAVALFIPKTTASSHARRTDGLAGLGLSGLLAFGVIMVGIVAGFGLVKLGGDTLVAGWIVIAASVLVVIPFLRWQARAAIPAIDVAALVDRRRGPYLISTIFVAIVFGAASVPLVTFVTTDREVFGYGMSASPGTVSILMLSMILTVIVAALLAGRVTSTTRRLWLLRIAPLFFVAEYTWFLLFHDSIWQGIVAGILGGIAAGILNSGLPAAIATAAPEGRVAADLGITNILGIAGGTAGSAIFALALHDTADSTVTAAPLAGYTAVWIISIGCALALGVILWFAKPPADPALTTEVTHVD